ncbi:hypothetical protein Bpfe_030513, partial [Biomphalaria pfeifferi]
SCNHLISKRNNRREVCSNPQSGHLRKRSFRLISTPACAPKATFGAKEPENCAIL